MSSPNLSCIAGQRQLAPASYLTASAACRHASNATDHAADTARWYSLCASAAVLSNSAVPIACALQGLSSLDSARRVPSAERRARRPLARALWPHARLHRVPRAAPADDEAPVGYLAGCGQRVAAPGVELGGRAVAHALLQREPCTCGRHATCALSCCTGSQTRPNAVPRT
jgi:hypothetical protein